MLCCYEAVKRVGPTGNVIGLVRNEEEASRLARLNLRMQIVIGDARNAIDVMNTTLEA